MSQTFVPSARVHGVDKFTKLAVAPHPEVPLPVNKAYRPVVEVPPELLKEYQPRDEFITSLYGDYGLGSTEAYDITVLQTWMNPDQKELKKRLNDGEQGLVNQCVATYQSLANLGGRLPKFTRWVASVFPDAKKVQEYFALELKKQGTVEAFTVGGSAFEIFNLGNSESYGSCMNTGSYLRSSNKFVANAAYRAEYKNMFQKCTGLALAYTVHPERGEMKGRTTLHHVKRSSDGADGLLMGFAYGGLREQVVAETLIRAGKIKFALVMGRYGNVGGKHKVPEKEKFHFVNIPGIGYWDVPISAAGVNTVHREYAYYDSTNIK
jgi:hypothetical protein